LSLTPTRAAESPDPWSRAYPWIRRVEGGWSDHPDDPGGPTYAGVTIPAVVGVDFDKDGELDFDLDNDGDVDRGDFELLRKGGHEELIDLFYRERYWHAVRATDLPWPWNLAVFDGAVNHGVGASVVLLQRALGVPQDGRIGPKTLGALHGAGRHRLDLLFAERSTLYRRICERRGWTFWNGWMIRLFLLRDEAGRPLGGKS